MTHALLSPHVAVQDSSITQRNMACNKLFGSMPHMEVFMDIRKLMTTNPACCFPDTPLPEVAKLMVAHDCGEIPVVDATTKKPVGVVTDRDITVRVVAPGLTPRICQRATA